jgi:hypothetical protein
VTTGSVRAEPGAIYWARQPVAALSCAPAVVGRLSGHCLHASNRWSASWARSLSYVHPWPATDYMPHKGYGGFR